MNNKRIVTFGLVGIAALVILYTIITYNGFVSKQEMVNNKWNEVNNAYQRRVDLIPTIVNVVKGLANFEQNIFTDIAAARANANEIASTNLTNSNINNQVNAQNSLAAATNKLLITVESYPELKGTSAFMGLQVQLEGTERRIKVARKDFNEVVANYNSSVKSFPGSLVAKLFGFQPNTGFTADDGAAKPIEIKF